MSDQFSRRIRTLETDEPPVVYTASDQNVSNPPSQADADAAFSATAAQVRDGWAGIIDDAGAGTTVWLSVSKNDIWHFVQVSSAGVVTPHNILSATHSDSVVNAVTRGSLIYGNSTPAWDELGFPGAANRLLTTNATDVLWSTWALVGTAAQTYTLPTTTGTLVKGSGAANRVTWWLSGEEVTSTAGFTFSGANFANSAGTISCPGGANSERFGASTTASGTSTTVTGQGSGGSGNNTTLYGQGLVTNNSNVVAVGRSISNLQAGVFVGDAIGRTGAFLSCVLVGNSIGNQGASAVGVGHAASVTLQSTAVGAAARATGQDSVSIGNATNTNVAFNVIVGSQSTIIGGGFIYSTAIGFAIALTRANTCAIGGLYNSVSWQDVGINTHVPAATIHASRQTALTNTVWPISRFDHYTSGVAAANFGSSLDFRLEHATGTLVQASVITTKWRDAAAATYSAQLVFEAASNTAIIEFLQLSGHATQPTIVFNENSLDIDFRVESNTNTSAMFLRGSDGHFGFGASAPDQLVELEELETLSGNINDGYAAALRFDPSYDDSSGGWTVTRHNYIDIQDVALINTAAVTNAAVLRFDNVFGTHKALAAAFNTTDSNTDTTSWAGGVIINVNGTLYKLPAIAI